MVHYSPMTTSVTRMGRRCPACGKDSWNTESEAKKALGRVTYNFNQDRSRGLLLPGEEPVRPRRVYQCVKSQLWHLTSAGTQCLGPDELWVAKMNALPELQLPDVDGAGMDWPEYRMAVAETILNEIRRRRDFFRFPAVYTISMRYTVNQGWVVKLRTTLEELGWIRYDQYSQLWVTRPQGPKRNGPRSDGPTTQQPPRETPDP